MSPRTRQNIGIVLIVLAAVLLVAAVCRITPMMFVDFPCMVYPPQELKPGTRIDYCISFWPLQALSGGGIYAMGTSDKEEVQAGELHLRRDASTLLVDGHAVGAGEEYATMRWHPLLNPWLILRTSFVIKNEGLDAQSQAADPPLRVSGDAHEGWFLNPLGPGLLGLGIWLLVRGRREAKVKTGA